MNTWVIVITLFGGCIWSSSSSSSPALHTSRTKYERRRALGWTTLYRGGTLYGIKDAWLRRPVVLFIFWELPRSMVNRPLHFHPSHRLDNILQTIPTTKIAWQNTKFLRHSLLTAPANLHLHRDKNPNAGQALALDNDLDFSWRRNKILKNVRNGELLVERRVKHQVCKVDGTPGVTCTLANADRVVDLVAEKDPGQKTAAIFAGRGDIVCHWLLRAFSAIFHTTRKLYHALTFSKTKDLRFWYLIWLPPCPIVALEYPVLNVRGTFRPGHQGCCRKNVPKHVTKIIQVGVNNHGIEENIGWPGEQTIGRNETNIGWQNVGSWGNGWCIRHR